MMKHLIGIVLLVWTGGICRSQDLQPFQVGTLWGYRDSQGVAKIESQFQYAKGFWGPYAVVAKQDKLGAIDKNNNLIIPYKYEFLRLLDATEFLFGHKAKYFGEYYMGVMTKDEKIKIPAVYENISKQNNAYIVTKTNDTIVGQSPIGDVRSKRATYGLMDSSGHVLIPCKYQYLSWKSENLIEVTLRNSGNNSMALFNNKGEPLTGFEYMVFGKFIDGLAKARIGDKYGFINAEGKVAMPVQFDFCEEFNNGYAIIKQQGKWGAIDQSGKVVIEPMADYEKLKSILKEK
jgi:hypothetical protein